MTPSSVVPALAPDATSTAFELARPIGRIPVTDVRPTVEHGAFPTVAVVDEMIPFSATVFREGHDACNASLVLIDPAGHETTYPMVCTSPGLDTWEGKAAPTSVGLWHFRVEGWSDPYATWKHDATIKIDAGVDEQLMIDEGALLLERALAVPGRSAAGTTVVQEALTVLRDASLPPRVQLRQVTMGEADAELTQTPLRERVSPSPTYPMRVERQRALFGAWYEFFPRSEGAVKKARGGWKTGTLKTAAKRLPAVAAMGFDVVYLTPVHPIGTTNRKGPNNTLVAGPEDPGSPYAIGSADGGHDALHPDLGTFEDFDRFVAKARKLGMEVALDIALQCSPDHPWVTSHPEWFTTRADGTIAYAENPPKKYQDIYPLNFDNDPEGIYAEVRRVIQVWIDHGVTCFRVDNPHTKPVEFWQWLIADVAKDHPDIIWLSEAFTKPAMMAMLAKVGFQQSYTYFAWRNTAAEVREYAEELAHQSAAYMRPSFWPTTHDILTPYVQHGGVAGSKIRLALAATLSPTYGLYSGYELLECTPRPGVEEHIDNEKYQFVNRGWEDYEPGGPKEGLSLAPYVTRINEIRRNHSALHWLRNVHFHGCDDDHVLVFSKRDERPGHDDVVVVVVNTDPHSTRETTITLDLHALGLQDNQSFAAQDLITGQVWRWGERNWVRLGKDTEPVHIVHIRRF